MSSPSCASLPRILVPVCRKPGSVGHPMLLRSCLISGPFPRPARPARPLAKAIEPEPALNPRPGERPTTATAGSASPVPHARAGDTIALTHALTLSPRLLWRPGGHQHLDRPTSALPRVRSPLSSRRAAAAIPAESSKQDATGSAHPVSRFATGRARADRRRAPARTRRQGLSRPFSGWPAPRADARLVRT